MTDLVPTRPPSRFVVRCLAQLSPMLGRGARALDVAAGRGRHTLALAADAFRVTAIDNRLEALADLRRAARAFGYDVTVVCADLTTFPLPAARFDLIVVSKYLDRAGLPRLLDAVSPGGVFVYETFTERQLGRGRGPTSRAHLLAPGELRTFVRGFDVLFDEEVTEPDALARIVARKALPPISSELKRFSSPGGAGLQTLVLGTRQ
jgi:SAM-dependent methyltransferase